MQYELNSKELGFEFRGTNPKTGAPLNVHVKMRPYQARDMIQLIKARAGRMQQAKDDVDAWDVKEAGIAAVHDFFDKHVIEVRVGKIVLTPEQINAFDARTGIKEQVIDRGYGFVQMDAPPAEAELAELTIDDLLSEAVTVKTTFCMTDENDVEQTLHVDHVFEYPSAMDSLTWDRAQIQQGLRQGGFRVQQNHEVLQTLYNKKISAVDGVVIDGAPCNAANKTAWVDAIPYVMKRVSLGLLFSRAERATRGN